MTVKADGSYSYRSSLKGFNRRKAGPRHVGAQDVIIIGAPSNWYYLNIVRSPISDLY
jgi:hypothetical protein